MSEIEITRTEPLMTLETFTAAFASLRAASVTRTNLVPLATLRAAFPGLSREQFDQALYELRKARAVVLESADGRHYRPTPELRSGAIVEGGRTFFYASVVE
jgi:hypothetical protein